MRKPRTRRTAAALAVATAGAALLAGTSAHAARGPNLLPNASFERSVVEPPPPVPPYTNPQPLLPEGWAFEGLAGLFDHSQNDHVVGRRMAAISIPLSGKRTVCTEDPAPEECVDDPTTELREETLIPYYSLPPAWRNAVPVAVLGGRSYTVEAQMKVAFVTAGEAALARVRWLDANLAPIGFSEGARLVSSGELESNWTLKARAVTSPAAARFAVVLLGHTTDAWLGQVRFDDVFFGLTSAP